MLQLRNHNSGLKYITFPFYKDGKPLEGYSRVENCHQGSGVIPLCGMTVRSAGSMRFRWAEKNPNRDQILSQISGDFGGKTFVPIQLNHTHIVYDISNQKDTDQKIGDGLITRNKNLIPTVTVADCLPVYLYEPETGVFGIVHSGWKGTGIACDAITLAGQKYGCQIQDFLIVIGPHIHDCCYIVNEERAEYFAENFSEDCVREVEADFLPDWNYGDKSGGKLYRLSLAKANFAALTRLGVRAENIFISEDCTSCSKNGFYGSNRRETKEAGWPDAFTVQAAFIGFK